MQIRAGNRQDENTIRAIIFNAMEECGLQPEPEGREDDLKNVETGYFWHDGIFVVAERDGEIIGVAGGRRHDEASSNTGANATQRDANQLHAKELELIRLAVLPAERKNGIAQAMIETIMFFAENMEYERVVLRTRARVIPGVLEKLGFALDAPATADSPPIYGRAVTKNAARCMR